jgi:hypothetical protein
LEEILPKSQAALARIARSLYEERSEPGGE